MRIIETHTGGGGEQGSRDSFAAPGNETIPSRGRVASPNKAHTETTQHHRVRSINTPDKTVHVRPPRISPEQKIVATADTPDDSATTPQQRPEGQQTDARSGNDEQQREGITDRGVIPPIEPPTDRPDASAEVPEPEHPWNKLRELAKIPPDPDQREEVRDLHSVGITRLLERHKEFADSDTYTDRSTNLVELLVMDDDNTVAINVSVAQEPTRPMRYFFNISFPRAPDGDEANKHHSYTLDRSGIVRKHIMGVDFINEVLPPDRPGEAPHRLLLQKSYDNYSKYGSLLELERELGVSDEVGLAEMQYLLDLAERAIPEPKVAEVLNVMHTGRIDGVPLGYEDAEEGAREFTTHVDNFLQRKGVNAGECREGKLEGPNGDIFKYSVGLYQETNQPYTYMEYTEPSRGRVVMLEYCVVGTELMTHRTVQTYVGGELWDEQQTSARGDVTEARHIRNFINFPSLKFDQERWQT